MLATSAGLFTIAVLLAAADAPAKKGPADLQGKWKLVALEIKGETRDFADSPPRWVIKGDQVFYGGEEIARITVDPTATPKIIDLRLLKPKSVYEGVYAIDQDTLKLCFNGSAEGVKERPQDFSTKDKANLRLLVFKRDKTDEGDATEGLIGFVGLALLFDQDRNEIVVKEVLDGSPAKKAGLQRDDVVLKIAGAKPNGLTSAIDMVRQTKPGSKLAVRVRRDGKEQDIQIKVGILPFTVLAQLD
jgi:uncharacterized protein (TIGR03067 family)